MLLYSRFDLWGEVGFTSHIPIPISLIRFALFAPLSPLSPRSALSNALLLHGCIGALYTNSHNIVLGYCLMAMTPISSLSHLSWMERFVRKHCVSRPVCMSYDTTTDKTAIVRTPDFDDKIPSSTFSKFPGKDPSKFAPLWSVGPIPCRVEIGVR